MISNLPVQQQRHPNNVSISMIPLDEKQIKFTSKKLN